MLEENPAVSLNELLSPSAELLIFESMSFTGANSLVLGLANVSYFSSITSVFGLSFGVCLLLVVDSEISLFVFDLLAVPMVVAYRSVYSVSSKV